MGSRGQFEKISRNGFISVHGSAVTGETGLSHRSFPMIEMISVGRICIQRDLNVL